MQSVPIGRKRKPKTQTAVYFRTMAHHFQSMLELMWNRADNTKSTRSATFARVRRPDWVETMLTEDVTQKELL